MALLTLVEAAQRIHVPEATLRYWVHIGSGPQSARIGRRRMFRVEDVDAWVTAHFEHQAQT